MIDYFSHILSANVPILHLATYCMIFVGDVTELMFTVNGAVKLSQLEIAIKQHFKQWINGYFIKMNLLITSLSATVSKFVAENELLFFTTSRLPGPGAFSHPLPNTSKYVNPNAFNMFKHWIIV